MKSSKIGKRIELLLYRGKSHMIGISNAKAEAFSEEGKFIS